MATGIAAVVGVCAFLLVPLDLPPKLKPGAKSHASGPSVARAAPALAEVSLATEDQPPLSLPAHHASWLDLLPPPATAPAVLLTPDALRPLPPPSIGGCARERATEHASLLADAPSDVLFLLGSERHAAGDFVAAADYYEAFALHDASRDDATCTEDEKALGLCADAPRALETAIALRRGVGDEERAYELSKAYVETYGETRVADAARVSLVAGRALTRAGHAEEARRHLSAHTRRFARHVPVGERVRAWVARGVAEQESGHRSEAARSFRRALSIWDRGGASVVAMRLDEDGEELGSDFARTLDAVAEAGFNLAEARYGRFAALSPPRFQGRGGRREVERWVANRLRPWMVQKLRALARAEAAYRRVASLGVTRHRIAADARRGEMYRELLETFTSAPPVEVYDERESETAVLADWRSGPIAQLRARAREAFESCLATALRSRQVGRDAAICAEELSRVDPIMHPPRLELSPSHPLIVNEPARPGPIEPQTPAGRVTETCSG